MDIRLVHLTDLMLQMGVSFCHLCIKLLLFYRQLNRST